jgi:3',5'-cyclic-AMP phosphodiesterase
MSDLINPTPVRNTVSPQGDAMDRRGLLKCMAWAGVGLLWTVSGGVPRSIAVDAAQAATQPDGLAFVQISDSHIGFNKEANPDTAATLTAALARIQALPAQPSFLIHTGDITHLSKPEEFDRAAELLKGANRQIFYVPGEHDMLGDDGRGFLERYGKGTKGLGWYSFDKGGVHFVALVNVANFKPGGLGNLGQEQLAWLKDDLAGLSASTPIVVFTHIPLWTVYPAWGWGTEDSAQALALLKRFGSVTVLNGHIHQVLQKVEGHVAFHTAMSTAYPQPAPGAAPAPGPLKVPTDRLRQVLGITDVSYVAGKAALAVVDTPLSA